MGEAQLLRLRDALAEHAGELPVRLTAGRGERHLRVSPAGRFKVRYGPALVAAVESLLGPGTVVPVTEVAAEEPVAARELAPRAGSAPSSGAGTAP